MTAWIIFARRFDPALSQASLKPMSRMAKPPKGKLENVSFLIEKSEETVKRQDGRTGRQTLTDDMKRAKMMDVWPAFQ